MVRQDSARYALSQRPSLSLIPLSVRDIRAMGRSFTSVRLGVMSIADRWKRVYRARGDRDRKYCGRLADLAKQHSSEAFVGCDDPLEAAIFSVLVELHRERDGTGRQAATPGEQFAESDRLEKVIRENLAGPGYRL
jgi:hypothetical protein